MENLLIKPNMLWRLNSSTRYYLVLYNGGYNFADTLKMDVECFNFEDNNFCNNAINLECGQSIQLNSPDPNLTSDMQPCSDEDIGGWLSVKGTGDMMSLEISSSNPEFGEMIFYIAEGTCDTFKCIDYFNISQNRRIVYFLSEKGKTYFLKYNILYGFGPFNFKLNCTEYKENFLASNAKSLECNQTYFDIINPLIIDVNTQDFKNFKPGVFYKIPILNKLLKLDFAPFAKRQYVIVYRLVGDQLFYFTSVEINSEKNYVELISKEDEYIIKIIDVDEFNQSYVHFNAICYEIPVNINCQNAIDLDCSDQISDKMYQPINYFDNSTCTSTNGINYWYKLPKSEIVKIDVFNKNVSGKIAKGSCENLYCDQFFSERSKDISVYNPDSSDFYLVIESKYADTSTNSFKIECLVSGVNTNCFDASTMECGDTLKVDLSRGYHKASMDIEKCYLEGNSGYYFDFQGDGKVWNFLRDPSIAEHYSIAIFKKDSCINPTCIIDAKLYQNVPEIAFLTEMDTVYTLYLSYDGYFPPSILLTSKCFDTLDVFDCSDAVVLNSIDTIAFIYSVKGERSMDRYGIFDISGSWFSFIGNGKVFKFTNKDYGDVSFRIYQESCEFSKCIITGKLSGFEQYKFTPSSGKKYYFYLAGQDDFEEITRVQFTNYNIPMNDDCTKADDIFCGKTVNVNPQDFEPTELYYCSSLKSGWYRFKSEETKVIQIRYSQNAISSISIHESCNKICFSDIYEPEEFDDGVFVFEFKKNREYLLSFNFRNKEFFGDVQLSFDCVDLDVNAGPERANEITCDNVHINSQNQSEIYTESCNFCFNKSSLWYKFKGNGSEVYFLSNSIYPNIEILDEDLKYIGSPKWLENKLTTEMNKNYFIKIDFPEGFVFEDYIFGVEGVCPSNLDNENLQSFSMSPNPVFSELNIQFPKIISGANILIYSITGELVLSINTRNALNSTSIDLSTLQSGIYLVRVLFENQSMVKKIVKI